MRLADHIMRAIAHSGSDVVFTLSGNQIMPLFDAAIDGKMRLVHTRHEAAAVYMADGYARASGKVGIALTTAGPGLTNALGPLYALSASESPVLLISGDSPLALEGKKPFQELDQAAVVKHLLKESWRLTQMDKIYETIEQAMILALSGRPGPVHLAIPEDLLAAAHQDLLFHDEMSFDRDPIDLNPSDLSAIARILEESTRPLVITGASLSMSRSPALVSTLEKNLGIPVISMSSPRGLKDPTLGRLGDILLEADSIILIDKDPDFSLGFGDSRVLPARHVGMCAATSSSITLAQHALSGRLAWGCIADPVCAMMKLANLDMPQGDQLWLEEVKANLTARPRVSIEPETITAARIMSVFSEIVDHSSPPLVVSDGGEFGQWAQGFLPYSNIMDGMLITNGLSGAIGGAIPQAIGVALAREGQHVVVFTGDGALGFHVAEIETARRLGLPLTVIVGNDCRWGAEVEIQRRQYGDERAQGCYLDDKTRYDQVAEGFGAKGFYVDNTDDLASTMNQALSTKGTTLVNIMMKGLPAPSFD